MPLSDLPRIQQGASQAEINDYLIMLGRRLNDFLNHLDSLNVDELTADLINTGTLNANLVSIAATNGGNSLTIDTNGIRGNNGLYDTIKFDLATGLLTIVSALIQSATGYPKVEINSSNNLLAAYKDANNSLQIIPVVSGQNAPGIVFNNNGINIEGLIAFINGAGLLISTQNASSGDAIILSSNRNLNLASSNGQPINLSPSGALNINGTAGYTGSVSVVTSVNFTTQTTTSKTLTFNKGICTNIV